MDHCRFISVIKQFPQVWDRNCSTFREQSLKNEAWDRIGEIMACPAALCKDTFKSLREKYVREREKQTIFGEKCIPWQHLDSLSFLDPHIILRKQTVSYEAEPTKTTLSEMKHQTTPVDEAVFMQYAENYSDFDKTLIALVRKASPIWDRKSNGYPSKQVKYQLWRGIGQALNKDVNVCMMRWKGLREKYIRQKNKYQEGEGKWEFLDDMAFLDRVIQYRRKNCEPDYSRGQAQNLTMSDHSFQFSEKYEDSVNDSSDGFAPSATVKSEDFGCCDMQDSSYDSGTSSGRKRSTSDHSEVSVEKRERLEEVVPKSPEVTFGELVAAMLAKKTDRDKNIAMIEIMKILTK